MTSDKPLGEPSANIGTGGSAYVGGNVDTGGGDFVSRDKHVYEPTRPVVRSLHQLRAPVPDFVGREGDIETLVHSLSQARVGTAPATICLIHGLGGIGKTELAYQVADRLKDSFTDAQLVLNLRGTSSEPLPIKQALQMILRAFEPTAELSDQLDELIASYRSALHRKHVLVLADDAKDAAQVRPLLPPVGSVLLITSRYRFPLEGMREHDLAVLNAEEAERLVLTICRRIEGHASRLAELCGYLPLALRVTASLLKQARSRDVAEFLEALTNERTRLSVMRVRGDLVLDVEASLELSFRALDSTAQAVLCQLSVFPAPFDRRAARAIVEVADGDNTVHVDEALDLLEQHSLLEWDETTERYRLHDLVRVFAAARLEDVHAVYQRYSWYFARLAFMADIQYYQGVEDEVKLAGLILFDRERVHIDRGWALARTQAGTAAGDLLLAKYADATAFIGDIRYDTRRERIPQLEMGLVVSHSDSEELIKSVRPIFEAKT